MKNLYFLAIDIGASSGRHFLGHLENGKLCIEEIYRFKNGLVERHGHLCWDVDHLFSEIIAGLKEAGRLNKKPAYIGIDTWGVDYALLDSSDHLIGDVFGYRDNRTQEAIHAINELIPPSALYQRTGIQYQPFNTVFQLYADRRSGKLASASTFLMLPDYFNFLLTGVKKQEYTNATTTGLLNAATHGFDQSILSALNLPSHLFQSISLPGTLLGSLRPSIAQEIGYQTQVMLPCTHDTASAVAALPSLEPMPYISSGTWSLLGIERKTPLLSENARLANFTNEGSQTMGFRFQKNIMGLWMMQKLREELKDRYDFAELSDLARSNPVALSIDVNDPRFLAPKSMAEEIQEAVGSSLTSGQIAYCVLNSLSLLYSRSLTEMEGIVGTSLPNLFIIGGGSQNTFLNELTAKATRKTIVTGPAECTAIGNLLCLMEGAGLIKSESEGKQLIIDSFLTKEANV